MDVITRYECPTCGQPVEVVTSDEGTSYYSGGQTIREREAVEALEKIEARANPKRSLDSQAAAVALDSIYRWAQKGLRK